MVFFRKLFILQLVGLVLTYNFTNCDFKNIVEEYQNIIYPPLKDCINGTKFNQMKPCYNLSDCLLKIERHTFSSTGGCPSLSKECFALKTKATLTRHCPGYSGIQISNAQETKKKEVTRNCLKQASQIQGWWRHFSQISGV